MRREPPAGQGRRVLVTGASTGIGRATVRALDEAGFRVLATVRRAEDADAIADEFGGRVDTALMDLLDESSVRALGESVVAAGPLFAVVNNAGAALPGPLEYLPIEVFRRQLDINLTGQLLVTQVVLPALRRSAETTGDARIVMMGSIAGRVAGPMLGAYAAAKHGLAGLAGSLRAELTPWGFKVLLVEPGAIATPIWASGQANADELAAADPEAFRRYAAQSEAMSRMARRGASRGLAPEVVGQVVLKGLTDRSPIPRQVVGRDAGVLATIARLLPYRAQYRLARAR